jgi:hypothetical protein
MDNISFSNALPIGYASLLDVAIGRRPYLTEAHGSLLLMPSLRLQGLHLNVVAELPCANWSTNWSVDVLLNVSIVLKFPFTRLPHDIDNDLRVTAYGIPWRKDPVVIWRRLMRHVPGPAVAPTSTAAVYPSSVPEPTQVDHHIRALRGLPGGPPVAGWSTWNTVRFA